MNKEINKAVTEITEAANRIKEISEEVMGIGLSDILRLHRNGERVVVGRTINGARYYTAGDISTFLTSDNYSDIRRHLVERVTRIEWAEYDSYSDLTCFILK